jgi:hypothetical protein
MATAFSREEKIAFDHVVEGFDDMLVISKAAEVDMILAGSDNTDHQGDRVWLPAPLISASFDGFDQTANFADATELSVPATIGYHKSVPIKLSSKNLRNERYMKNKAQSAKVKLASDANLALYNTVALQGTLVSKRTVAATGYDDVSLCDALMTEIGVPADNRFYFASPRNANLMAGDLAKRGTFSGEVQNAYERARLGIDIAGFDVYKNDQTVRLTAAAGVTVTVNGAGQYYTPKATSTAATGEISNVDNRYQNLAITVTSGAVKVGDCFTIAGVNSVNMISKQDTGQLKTFRVVGIVSGAGGTGTIQISPPIISNGGGTAPEKEFQNVTATPASGAAIVWLNTTTADTNPFFKKESLILLPGSFAVDPEDGWNVMRATTESGIGITYARQGQINDLGIKARWDIDFGTCLANPEMAGLQLFGQA